MRKAYVSIQNGTERKSTAYSNKLDSDKYDVHKPLTYRKYFQSYEAQGLNSLIEQGSQKQQTITSQDSKVVSPNSSR